MSAVTASVYQQTITAVLREQFGRMRNAAKELAILAGVTTRTAENWLDGLCAPRGDALLRLEARCEAVEAAMAELRTMARGGR